MDFYSLKRTKLTDGLKLLLFISCIITSCTIPRKYQKNKPFIFKNSIEIKGDVKPLDKKGFKQRLATQYNDSAKVVTKDILFLLHIMKRPPAFDTIYAYNTAGNMKATLLHMGYYRAKVSYTVDTVKYGRQRRVSVKYLAEPGIPTLIDTFEYRLKNDNLQLKALQTKSASYLKKSMPVTKADIYGEIGRLVELYRNNGYYKFTSDDLRMRGDTTIEALTNVSDDPFENLRLLAEANANRNKPTIKLAMVLNKSGDTTKQKQYYINNVYIYPDYNGMENTRDTLVKNYIIRYHQRIFQENFLIKNVVFKKGDLYKQEDYLKTINSFSKINFWKNINIEIKEVKTDGDSLGKIDMHIQLIPGKKFGFETNLEASYSSNSTSNNATISGYAGNLLGLSLNTTLQNRNWLKEGAKMTHALRGGIELNLSTQKSTGKTINSTELSYNNTISFPRLITPIKNLNKRKLLSTQSFINTNLAYTNRIDLFNLQSLSLALGYDWKSYRHPNRNWIIKPLNVEFSYLYKESDTFKVTLANNPYLRYSYNTALVLGANIGYLSSHESVRKPNLLHTFKFNFEESGFLLGAIPIKSIGLFKNYLRQYAKFDIDYTMLLSRPKSARVVHAFVGIGIPIGSSDSSLPFFKQYFAGGSNSMRGWPVRGIGPGAKPLAPYGSRTLNDRTGDIKIELNGEYRYNIAQNIFNVFSLKGALFIDAGNVWNFNKSTPAGVYDSLQFDFRNLYKQLGVNVGTGFRLDFNYVVLRVDLGFRFKRPDLKENDGWKIPDIGINDVFDKIFTKGYRQWRYENFNFSLGIGLPFQ